MPPTKVGKYGRAHVPRSEVILEGGKPVVEVGHVGEALSMDKGNVREGADDFLSITFEDLSVLVR